MYPWRAVPVYLIRCGVSALCSGVIFTALSAYYVSVVGMNPLQLVLVGTAIELTCFLFEVPTGVVADSYSRRLSVIIGGLLIGLCYVLTGLTPLFLAIIVAEIIRGIGETFISGALNAWITDEVGEEHVGPVFVRGSQVGRIGGLIGVWLSVGLASLYGYAVPITLGGGLWIALSLFQWLTMPETGFQPTARGERTHAQTLWQTFRGGLRLVRGTPILLLLLISQVVYGAFSEGFDRLWEAHFLTGFTLPTLRLPWIGALDPIAWFGIFELIGTGVGLIGAEVVQRRVNLADQGSMRRTLFVFYTLVALGAIAFGFANNFVLAAVAFLVTTQFRGLAYPIFDTWLNQNIPSSVRATVISLVSQGNAFGQMAGGPGVGAVGRVYGIRAALVLSGVILSPLLVLYGRSPREHPLTSKMEDDALSLP